jgi:hypothetical protein
MKQKDETIEDVLERRRRAWRYGRISLYDLLFSSRAYMGRGRRRKHKANRQGDCKRAWGL